MRLINALPQDQSRLEACRCLDLDRRMVHHRLSRRLEWKSVGCSLLRQREGTTRHMYRRRRPIQDRGRGRLIQAKVKVTDIQASRRTSRLASLITLTIKAKVKTIARIRECNSRRVLGMQVGSIIHRRRHAQEGLRM